MNTKLIRFLGIFLFFSQVCYAQPDLAQLSVWANEAIVATYTYSYKNYVADQKKIAQYFTADGWIDYSNALTTSKLPDVVQKNLYYVSAVATDTPIITNMDTTHWKAAMGLLVVYQNPQYQQKQFLKVTIDFMVPPSGQGVRGYSITKLQSVVNKAPCKCDVETATTEAINTNSDNAKK